MRVIIAGGRDLNDYNLLNEECYNIIARILHEEPKTIEIVSGGANGADKLGERFAKEWNINIKQFIPDWNIGRQAGILRNIDMAIYAKEDNGVLIAFYDGKSKGTGHMINLAKKHGLQVFVVKY